MARTGFFHHIGTFLLFSATVLLIIVCISAPVVRDIYLAKISFGPEGRSSVVFGTWGYCPTGILNQPDGDRCSKARLGYSPASIINSYASVPYSDAAISTSRSLTKAFVLHPIAAGLNFIAFMLALGAGMVGSLLAALVALLAFLTTAVACVLDFVAFAIVRNKVNSYDRSDELKGEYGNAAWCLLVAAICSLVGAGVVLMTCCSGRLRKRRERRGVVKGEGVVAGDGYGVPVQRRRRWF
ncbi:pali-domain-containing protein [Podospora fimiseda]|uniref:Pali-domain-containing protein n=1 Tax=Podospora fimiseda TaxID=252190 RepID=A0AAN7GUW4_9PEZI|nr:pali-domain-containing protein [Podospora fimiseda]